MGSISKLVRSRRRRYFVGAAACLIILPSAALGCVGWDFVSLMRPKLPAQELSEGIGEAELRGHIEYLAHSRLKGRMPLSMGSAISRDYIMGRFEELGLEPWGEAESYEQTVKLGTNVIGVLSGTDETVADEMIVVSAHYDHIGGDYLGACDNASGVAVLLECAERLALAENRPRRSVCFAAFDSEERGLWGAMAFTCRDDFDASKIAAIVNVDMLGRQFLDVYEDTLFVSGTGLTESIQRDLRTWSTSQETTLLPVGVRFVGPRSDHAALDTLGIPSLFFSCGLFPDYHTKGDTVEKLLYDDILSGANIVSDTVASLAGHERPLSQYIYSDDAVEEEIASLQHLLNMATTDYADAFREEALAEAVRLLEALEAAATAETMDPATERALILDATTLFLPLSAGAKPEGRTEDTKGDRREQEVRAARHQAISALMYERYGDFIMGGYRGLVHRTLATPFKTIFWRGMSQDEFEVANKVIEEDVLITVKGVDAYTLDALTVDVHAHWDVAPFLRHGFFSTDARGNHMQFEGSRDEIVDAILLRWLRYHRLTRDLEYHRTRLAAQGHSQQEIASAMKWLENEGWRSSWDASIARILTVFTGENLGDDVVPWRDWWLEKNNLSDEDALLARALHSNNDDARKAAIDSLRWVGDPKENSAHTDMVRAIACSQTAPVELRYSAMYALAEAGERDDLLTLLGLTGDRTSVGTFTGRSAQDRATFFEAYHGHPFVFAMKLQEEISAAEHNDQDTQDKEDEFVAVGDWAKHLAGQLLPPLDNESDEEYGARFEAAAAALAEAERALTRHPAANADAGIMWWDGYGFGWPFGL